MGVFQNIIKQNTFSTQSHVRWNWEESHDLQPEQQNTIQEICNIIFVITLLVDIGFSNPLHSELELFPIQNPNYRPNNKDELGTDFKRTLSRLLQSLLSFNALMLNYVFRNYFFFLFCFGNGLCSACTAVAQCIVALVAGEGREKKRERSTRLFLVEQPGREWLKREYHAPPYSSRSRFLSKYTRPPYGDGKSGVGMATRLCIKIKETIPLYQNTAFI